MSTEHLSDGKRLVLVVWKDAQSIASLGRWVDPGDVETLDLAVCKSVGWIFRESAEGLILFAHDAGDQLGGELCIPKSCIVSVEELAPIDAAKRFEHGRSS